MTHRVSNVTVEESRNGFTIEESPDGTGGMTFDVGVKEGEGTRKKGVSR